MENTQSALRSNAVLGVNPKKASYVEPCGAEVFHVVDFIEEELEVRGWDMWTLAAQMSASRTEADVSRIKLSLEFLELREPGVLVGEEGAEQLARAFGTSKQLWLNLDRTWQQHNGELTRARGKARHEKGEDS